MSVCGCKEQKNSEKESVDNKRGKTVWSITKMKSVKKCVATGRKKEDKGPKSVVNVLKQKGLR